MNPLGGSQLMMSGVKGVENMSSSRLLTEPRGPLLAKLPTCCCDGGWGSQSVMTGAAEGPGYAPWAVASCGSPPGVRYLRP